MASLDLQTQGMVYIITYSQTDTSKLPTRESFIQAVIEAWKFYGINILHWVVCIEAHANLHSESGDDLNYYHFHMAVKLEKRGWWLQVKEYLNEKFGVQVHFSDHHNSYYSTYKYVTKEDTEALHSPGHPDLTTVPKTQAAMAGRKQKGKEVSAGIKRKQDKERLTVYDLSKITSRLQLVCLAMTQE